MSIKPPGQYIALVGNVTSTLFVDSINEGFEIIAFDRVEYTNAKQREAPTILGGHAKFVTNVANIPIQVDVTCSNDIARPTGPDNTNVDLIKRTFNCDTWQITGAISHKNNVEQVREWFKDHKKRLQAFDLHQAKASQMELGIQQILNLQDEDFSFITGTGLHIYGGDMLPSTWITDVLITEFQATYEFVVYNDDGSRSVWKAFTMTIQKRTLGLQSEFLI